MRLLSFCTLVVGCALASAGIAPAQPVPGVADEAAPPTAASRNEPGELEEVTVRGTRSLRAMRVELVRAQERLYELFNAAIADPKFEIMCDRRTPTGTRISQRTCETRYMQDSLTTSAQMAFAMAAQGDSGLVLGNPFDVSAEMANNERALVEKMVTAINETPELRQAVLDFAAMQQQYLDAEEERFGPGDED